MKHLNFKWKIFSVESVFIEVQQHNFLCPDQQELTWAHLCGICWTTLSLAHSLHSSCYINSISLITFVIIHEILVIHLCDHDFFPISMVFSFWPFRMYVISFRSRLTVLNVVVYLSSSFSPFALQLQHTRFINVEIKSRNPSPNFVAIS